MLCKVVDRYDICRGGFAMTRLHVNASSIQNMGKLESHLLCGPTSERPYLISVPRYDKGDRLLRETDRLMDVTGPVVSPGP